MIICGNITNTHQQLGQSAFKTKQNKIKTKQKQKTCKQKRYCLIKKKKKKKKTRGEKMGLPVYKLGEQTVIRVVLRSKYIQSI